MEQLLNTPQAPAETPRPDWLYTIPGLTANQDALLQRAWAAMPSGRGSPADAMAASRVVEVARIVADLGLDAESLAAELLRAAPAYRDDAERLAKDFGADIAALMARLKRTDQIETLLGGSDEAGREAARLERLRKMVLAMAEDLRVVLIMLAERVVMLRGLADESSPAQQRIARNTMDLFAPLANRLGVWQLKWEMEDLAFRELEPERFQRIVQALDEKREARERFIAQVMARIRDELAAAGIQADFTGRPKHIFSIWKKMQRKGVDVAGLYDLRAVRVMVPSVKDCYAVLALVHDLWEPVAGEFDDYIAKPKANNYRSLHTAVWVDGQSLEVQIRTPEMHRESELGVAAHWRYKEGTRADKAFDAKIAWVRQILDWKSDLAASGALTEKIKSALFDDTIFVLTPQGRVVDLPARATPIDFAYHLHSDLGHRCRGAKVDGQIVPLNTRLRNAQTVEVIAAKQGGPSRDWLNPEQGYLVSPRALAKVRHWFRLQFHEQEVAAGRAVLEKELARLGKTGVALEKVAEALHAKNVDEMLAEMGRGEITPRAIDLALAPEVVAPPAQEMAPTIRPESRSGASGGVLVLGVANIATTLAKCCKPVPPDAIVGFVTKARGVAVHRADCASIARLDNQQRERLMPANWGATGNAPFPVDIDMTAQDRTGLLRDITEALSREKINVTATNSISRANLAHIRFTVEVSSADQLGRVLRELSEVPGVLEVRRR